MLWVSSNDIVGKHPTCVVDVRLSLAPTGLFFVLGLSRALPVWLPQCHWTIVDDDSFLRDRRLVTHLSGGADPEKAEEILIRTRNDWRVTREAHGLESMPGLYWPSSGRGDSIVPKDGDATLIDRVHVLSAGLDARSARGGVLVTDCADPLADCARDTLALAAALLNQSPVVLAVIEQGEEAPELARYLKRAGLSCNKVTDIRLIDSLRQTVMPALIASGLVVHAVNQRVRLAALYMVAPGSITAPSLAEAMTDCDDNLAFDANANGGESALWDGASAMWWEPLE
jgi:hypothetical protein